MNFFYTVVKKTFSLLVLRDLRCHLQLIAFELGFLLGHCLDADVVRTDHDWRHKDHIAYTLVVLTVIRSLCANVGPQVAPHKVFIWLGSQLWQLLRLFKVVGNTLLNLHLK